MQTEKLKETKTKKRLKKKKRKHKRAESKLGIIQIGQKFLIIPTDKSLKVLDLEKQIHYLI